MTQLQKFLALPDPDGAELYRVDMLVDPAEAVSFQTRAADIGEMAEQLAQAQELINAQFGLIGILSCEVEAETHSVSGR